jgi:hypothetical protein
VDLTGWLMAKMTKKDASQMLLDDTSSLKTESNPALDAAVEKVASLMPPPGTPVPSLVDSLALPRPKNVPSLDTKRFFVHVFIYLQGGIESID